VSYEFKLPDLGEGLTEGEIARWLVAEGQEIGEDDPLVEIQTDKTTVEIPSPAAGKVARIFVAEGETVAVGTVLVVIGEDRGAPASDEHPRAEGATQKQAATEVSDVSARLAPGHGSPGRVRATPLVRPSPKCLCSLATQAFVVVSQTSRRNIELIFGGRICYLPNLVKLRQISVC